MGKNITIGFLIITVIALVCVIVFKENEKPIQPSVIYTQKNTSQSQVVLPKDAVLLAQSKDKKYSAYTAFTISDRDIKLSQISKMWDQDIPGKGDTVYLKDNTTGEVAIIFSDLASENLSVKNGQFLEKNNLFLFETGILFSYDLSSKIITNHSRLQEHKCAIGDVGFISPNETSIVVGGWCGQEGGSSSIVDLKSWKVLWSVYSGIGDSMSIKGYKTDQSVLVDVYPEVGPNRTEVYSLTGTLLH